MNVDNIENNNNDKNETLKIYNSNINLELSKIILKHENKNNLYNAHNKSFINYFCIRKIRKIVLGMLIILIICGIIIFTILYFKKRNDTTSISFKQSMNNTDNINGFYVPKDNILSYRKCSVEYCKKCYGNSYNDTCISCLNSSYEPIIDENNKIISCKYYQQQEEDKNITINESYIPQITDNILENITQLISENITNNILENLTQLISEKNLDNLSNNTQLISENITDYITIFKSEIFNVNSTDNISEIKAELLTQNITIEIHENTTITVIETSNITICAPGFYLPEGDNIEKECKQCSIFGCEICHGNNFINYCDSCFVKYIPKYVNNNIICVECTSNCIECDQNTSKCLKCDDEFILQEGKCFSYSFEAIYFTDVDNSGIRLINLEKIYIKKIIIENRIINATNPYTYITLPHSGYHTAYYFIQNNPISFDSLFDSCSNLVSVKFTSHFKSENISSLYYMFGSCSYLISIDFANFDTSNVDNMDFMFRDCYKLRSINLSNLNTRNVASMYGMFQNCFSLKILDLEKWNAQSVTDFSYMFYNCSSLTSLILPSNHKEKNESKLSSVYYMFYNCSKLTFISFLRLDLSNVESMESMFEGCSSLKGIYIHSYVLVEELQILDIPFFKRYLYDFNPKKVVYTDNMFKDCISLKRVNISNWNFEYTISMSNMFENCNSLENITLGKYNLFNLEKMDYLFYNCFSLKSLDLKAFNNSYHVVTMSHMFENCKSLKEIDLSSFKLTSVEDIQYMFSGCSSLISVNFYNIYNNNKLKYMNSLFSGCSLLSTINFNSFNIREVIDMSRMFYNCSSITRLNLNSFNTTKVEKMDEMFYGCSSLIELNIMNFVGNPSLTYNNMFDNSNTNMTIYTNYEFFQILNNLFNN